MRISQFLLPMVVIVHSGLSNAAVTPVVGPIADPYGNDVLYVIPRGTWTADEAAAVTLGGYLVTIHSAAEDAFIVANVAKDFTATGGPNLSNLPLWIGYEDPTGALVDDGPGGIGSRHAADFVWADKSTSTFTDWYSPTNEPSDGGGNEYFAALNWHLAQSNQPAGTWNDVPVAGSVGYGGNSDGPYYGIVEVAVPEPSVVMIGLLSVVGIGLRGRSKTADRPRHLSTLPVGG